MGVAAVDGRQCPRGAARARGRPNDVAGDHPAVHHRQPGYRTLLTAPGEPFIVRGDLVINRPSPGRAARRRSLPTWDTSDIHIQDTQSPARLEPVMEFSPTLMPGICRPQESMSLFVQAQMVQAFNDAASSPVTGAPMAAVVNTGDSSDQISNLETRWYIKVMDGVPVVGGLGHRGCLHEGVEVWPEATHVITPMTLPTCGRVRDSRRSQD